METGELGKRPLILTLQIDADSQAFYDALRERYFPAERNFIAAHLTLFHHLPDEERTYEAVRVMAEATAEFQLAKGELRSLGRGVAVFFESAEVCAMHAKLAQVFEAELIPQDRQKLRPHIVVQNKVDGETVRQTLALLQGSLLRQPLGVGLTLWRYLGGPWEHVGDFPFGAGA